MYILKGIFPVQNVAIENLGKPTKEKKTRKIGLVIMGILIAIGIFYVYSNPSLINSAQEFVQDSKPISEAKDYVEDLVSKIKIPEGTKITIPEIKLDDISGNQQTAEKESMNAIEYVNQLRKQNGKEPISWDPRVYQLALAWTENMYENSFFDHTNPETGECPFTMKSAYGLQKHEFVADNVGALMYSDGLFTYYTPNFKQQVDNWMDSRGHRYNLLYDHHKAGAYACTGGACTFMGLNNFKFGAGCSTAEEGVAYWNKAGKQPGEIP